MNIVKCHGRTEHMKRVEFGDGVLRPSLNFFTYIDVVNSWEVGKIGMPGENYRYLVNSFYDALAYSKGGLGLSIPGRILHFSPCCCDEKMRQDVKKSINAF